MYDFVIPNNVAYIEEDTFADNLLTSVVIPDNVVYIIATDPETGLAVRIIDDGNAAEIIGYTRTDTDLQIPAQILGLSVAVIGYRALQGGEWRVERGDWFEVGHQLTGVAIPNTVTRIREMAFVHNLFTEVVIPHGVTHIERNAFASNRIASVSIPNSVVYLSGFFGNQLTEVSIPNGVTIIGDSAFSANQLAGITISDSVTHIGNSAFSSNQFADIAIPDGVTHIGNAAFLGNQLSTVDIPESVVYVGDWAFANNRRGFRANVPDIFISIGRNTFGTGRGSMVRVPSQARQAWYESDPPHSFERDFAWRLSPDGDSVTITGFGAAVPRRQDLRIPPQIFGLPVTSIGVMAFRNGRLTSVTIPDSVVSIGFQAFASNQLASIDLPDNVTSIGEYAFAGNQLASITIGSDVGFMTWAARDLTGGFGEEFIMAYESQGRMAGTYTYNAGGWDFQPR